MAQVPSEKSKVEQALYFQDLSRRAIDALGRDLRVARQAEPDTNPLGCDLEAIELDRITAFFSGGLKKIQPFDEAQIRELAFWRWVAYKGYAGQDPRAFPFHQEHLMVSTFYRTGWCMHDFLDGRILELGCGPLGMIEYLPAKERVAFDPLNMKFNKLFSKLRSKTVAYLSERAELTSRASNFDLAICHNVIDHTEDPAFWFNTLFAKLAHRGHFIFQVNLSTRSHPQTAEHRKMHPSPFIYDQAMEWLRAKSGEFEHSLSEQPTSDGELHFMAWGRKTRDTPVAYRQLIRF